MEHGCVEDTPSMLAALERGTWDVLLGDWSSASFNASAALELLKSLNLDIQQPRR